MTAIDRKSFKSTKKMVDSDAKGEEVATEPITKELREYIENNRMSNGMGVETMWGNSVPYDLLQIADRIDAEHETRMSQSRQSSRLAAIRYLRGVLLDYEKSVKRVRKGDAAEVVRCKDCQWARRMDDRFVCTVRPLMAHLVDGSDYCSRGVRKEVDE